MERSIMYWFCILTSSFLCVVGFFIVLMNNLNEINKFVELNKEMVLPISISFGAIVGIIGFRSIIRGAKNRKLVVESLISKKDAEGILQLISEKGYSPVFKASSDLGLEKEFEKILKKFFSDYLHKLQGNKSEDEALKILHEKLRLLIPSKSSMKSLSLLLVDVATEKYRVPDYFTKYSN
jgi:hypothetical protein